jgi:hypothetical protein
MVGEELCCSEVGFLKVSRSAGLLHQEKHQGQFTDFFADGILKQERSKMYFRVWYVVQEMYRTYYCSRRRDRGEEMS